HDATIPAASDIDKGAIANGEGSTGIVRQGGPHRPTDSQLFVDIDREADRVVSARGNNAAIVYVPAVEPYPSHVHGWPGAPTVGNGVEDWCGGDENGESRRASEQVEFPLVHGAARPTYWRRHVRTGCPGVSRDIVDVQCVHFEHAVATTGNV